MKNIRYLKERINHIGIETNSISELMDAFSSMAFQSRNLSNAADIYNKMLGDKDCTIILCLAGSLFSAGLKRIVYQMVSNNMVDAIVSTGAIIVDQDFFEGLGFSHYRGTPMVDDEDLRKSAIDRIYDTYISEDDLKVCDNTIEQIASGLDQRPYSSREFIIEMGRYLNKHGKRHDSVVLEAYKKGVPIFVPAFSDCSAGFGLVMHQWKNPQRHISIDSAKDFLELTKIKIASRESGLLMIGGGVPKNFAQDTVVAAESLNKKVSMHKYAVQITVADERDGALSGSTLKEAHSWGKIDTKYTQMVYSEATLALPLLASYAYHKGNWKARKPKNFNKKLEKL
ncbi:MAG: deoxyhypusine synthase [Candidatus Marsarchaeota archaeon]|nr:deoxyhypusine synthase [Candidatus Marsarchaeota archaeon]MCL5413398.1 deoxyhypusine synthase [Candidatus Marsarchaeota archaeon]